MNEKTENHADSPDSGNETSDQPSEEQSIEAGSAGNRQSLLQRLAALIKRPERGEQPDELANTLAERDRLGTVFSPGERAMLNNILRLRELRVEDVMIPRAEIMAVDTTVTLGQLMELFEQTGHSRMPVFQETLDDARGMVHIRDVLAHLTRTARKGSRTKKRANGNGNGNGHAANGNRQTPIGTPSPALDLSRVELAKTIGELNLMRPLLFVPPSMLASDLMKRMQAGRIQMALVIDEYGGTDGLVSLEDIVEMVIGDIEDEHDEDEPLIVRTGDGVFVVDARAEIEEVAAMIGDAFAAGEHGEYVDTIGGMIFSTLGRIPARGEVVQAIPGFEFQVLDADPRRVKRVRIVQGRVGDRRRRAPRSAGATAA